MERKINSTEFYDYWPMPLRRDLEYEWHLFVEILNKLPKVKLVRINNER